MNNLMLDLETMGNNPNAPIVAIGAVFFEPATGELGPEFYAPVNLKSSMASGAVPDAETIDWWLGQSQEARDAIRIKNAEQLQTVLGNLTGFIQRHADHPRSMKMWGNGASFDNVILRSAYQAVGYQLPWPFWNDADVRTMVLLGRHLGFDPKRDMPFDGVAHNALADARHQAKYVSAIWQRLLLTHRGSKQIAKAEIYERIYGSLRECPGESSIYSATPSAGEHIPHGVLAHTGSVSFYCNFGHLHIAELAAITGCHTHSLSGGINDA